MPRVTLKDIAAAARVSKMTVSLSLRNQPGVAKKTRDRIQRLARTLGYCPEPRLSELMSLLRRHRPRRTFETIVLAATVAPGGRFPPSEHGARIIAGARQRATTLGYRLEVQTWDYAALPVHRFISMHRARGHRGLLLHLSYGIPPNLAQIARAFACVQLGDPATDQPLHRVAHHHYNNMRLAMEQLTLAGYRRIGCYLHAPVDRNLEHSWRAAYVYHQQKLAGRVQPKLLRVTPAPHFDEFAAWLRQVRPDAVISHAILNDDWVRRAAEVCGNPVGFCHLDWIETPARFSGIDQLVDQVAEAGVDILGHLLAQNEIGIPVYHRTTMIDGVWRQGQTTEPVSP